MKIRSGDGLAAKGFLIPHPFLGRRKFWSQNYVKTRGLEALTRMLFFKFSVIIIGFCVKSEVQ